MPLKSAHTQGLEEGIKNEPDREQQLGLTLESLQRQLEDTKEQYKALVKRRVIDTMGKTEQQIEIIEETYTELEQDLTQRIAGLEAKINQSADSRNQLINLNRTAKTVMDVLQSILYKERLDKMDVSLIIDKIIVYEDRLDIHLKSDIDGLLMTGTLEDNSTFNPDSKDISIPPKLVQSITNRPDKVFTVNVVNEGEAVRPPMAMRSKNSTNGTPWLHGYSLRPPAGWRGILFGQCFSVEFSFGIGCRGSLLSLGEVTPSFLPYSRICFYRRCFPNKEFLLTCPSFSFHSLFWAV